jgi:hypothetical protein
VHQRLERQRSLLGDLHHLLWKASDTESGGFHQGSGFVLGLLLIRAPTELTVMANSGVGLQCSTTPTTFNHSVHLAFGQDVDEWQHFRAPAAPNFLELMAKSVAVTGTNL